MTGSSPDAAKYLWDARHAAERIARFTAGRSFDDYLADDMLRAAVERQFEIIGEAFSGLRRIGPEMAGTISDPPRIVAFRNVLIHGYATVDDQLVWGVVERNLPLCWQPLCWQPLFWQPLCWQPLCWQPLCWQH